MVTICIHRPTIQRHDCFVSWQTRITLSHRNIPNSPATLQAAIELRTWSFFNISCLWRFTVWTLIDNVPYVWIKAVRRLDAVEIFYSFDDQNYVMMRNAWLQDHVPVQVGLMGACPDGKGFNVTFEHFKVKHLPDQRRLEWLKKNW